MARIADALKIAVVVCTWPLAIVFCVVVVLWWCLTAPFPGEN
jgi:hypothetical protein